MSTPAPASNAPASTGSFFSSLFGSSKKPTNAAPPAPGTAVGGKRRASRFKRHHSRRSHSRKNRKHRSHSRRNRK
ncbi:MAG: hypothetical protein EB127_05160 [Alphaproteobacteria bacterium]|nr:hypothetical protein [Alphaproteobacteria bacterium]